MKILFLLGAGLAFTCTCHVRFDREKGGRLPLRAPCVNMRLGEPTSSALKIPSDSKFEESSLDNGGRPAPCTTVSTGIGGGFGEHRIRVQRVVNIEVRVNRVSFAYSEDLAET